MSVLLFLKKEMDMKLLVSMICFLHVWTVYSMDQLKERIFTSSIKGKRPEQQDRYVTDRIEYRGTVLSVIGLFDGHDTDLTAQLLKKHFVSDLKDLLNMNYSIKQSLKLAAYESDKRAYKYGDSAGGSTLLASLFNPSDNKVHIIWIGDSKAYSNNRGVYHVTHQHRPTDCSERERIESAGNKIINEKINGIIGVSRSLGDAFLKTKFLSLIPEPEYYEFTINPEHGAFVVYSTDGFSDYIKDKNLRGLLGKALEAENCACYLVDEVAERSQDNITVIVQFFGDTDWIKTVETKKKNNKNKLAKLGVEEALSELLDFDFDGQNESLAKIAAEQVSLNQSAAAKGQQNNKEEQEGAAPVEKEKIDQENKQKTKKQSWYVVCKYFVGGCSFGLLLFTAFMSCYHKHFYWQNIFS